MKSKNCLYIIVPCYNEEEILRYSAQKLYEKLLELSEKQLIDLEQYQSKILFVDDGSTDQTWNIICDLHNENSIFIGISLANNRGHQNALLAGLMFARDKKFVDITISIDADLQQDIDAMNEFILKHKDEGCDIIYGIRNNRNADSFFKKYSALWFYKIMDFLGCSTYKNSADYRLLSRRALDALSEYQEVNLFLRGIIPDMGFKSGCINFEVRERTLGKSKYTLSKMLNLAFDGITSFSIKPIRLIFLLGIIIFIGSIFMIFYTLCAYIMGMSLSGWSSIIIAIWMLGGLQILSLGIIGEYIGRSYMETKKRPRYLLKETCYDD